MSVLNLKQVHLSFLFSSKEGGGGGGVEGNPDAALTFQDR